MSDNTTIEWTDATWNPVSGCTKVSQGCKNCYAERVFPRAYPGRIFTDVRTHSDRLDQPLRWKRPRRVFVNSMSDLFHESVPGEIIDRVFAVMALSVQHTFQVLTKRPQRMLEWFRSNPYERILRHADVIRSELSGRALPQRIGVSDPNVVPYRNVWIGISAEDQATADERIPLLLQTPAVRFVSLEPLLGPVTLNQWILSEYGRRQIGAKPGLSWIIVGGESGPKARVCDVAWARSLVSQCREAGVPVFVKQIGSQPRGWCAWHTPECIGRDEAALLRCDDEDSACNQYEAGEPQKPCEAYGRRCIVLRDRKGGDPSEWPMDLRVREFPTTSER